MASNSITKNHHIFTQNTLRITGGDTTIKHETSNSDIIFNVNDDGSDNEVMRLNGESSSLFMGINRKIMFGALQNYIYGNANDIGFNASRDLTLQAGRTITAASADTILLDSVSDIILDAESGTFKFYDTGDDDDYFKITVADGTGATTLETVSQSADGHMKIIADGHVEFDNCAVGFDKLAGTFSTSGVIGDGNDSTDIDFRLSNKYELGLTDNIGGSGENINMIFPATSGNFLLVLTQDAIGSRTVAADGWIAYQSDGATKCTNNLSTNLTDGDVRWAGGEAPTLSTGARAVDVISIYWDADNQTALAVASLAFATP